MNNPLMKRMMYGKTLGFTVGVLALFALPMIWPDATWMIRLGVLFFYTVLGVMVGMFGVFDYHPVLKMRMPAWFRGSLLGASFMLVVVLIAYPTLEAMMVTAIIFSDFSPYWMMLDAAIVGLIIDVIITKKVGEGTSLCTGQ